MEFCECLLDYKWLDFCGALKGKSAQEFELEIGYLSVSLICYILVGNQCRCLPRFYPFLMKLGRV
jgi:hypothetical protein